MLVGDVIQLFYRKFKINNPGLHKSYNSNNIFYQLHNTQITIKWIYKKNYFSKSYLTDYSNVLT